MPDAKKTIYVNNAGSTPAKLSFEIKRVKIFDTTYEVGENLTSEQLKQKLEEDYPFKFSFIKSAEIVNAHNGKATLDIGLSWAFESGDDEKDTYWGKKAYEYHAINPQTPSIEVDIVIRAVQQEGNI